MNQVFKTRTRTALCSFACLFFCFMSASGASASESFRIETFKTHSRIVVQLDPSIPVKLKSDGKKFEIDFRGITLSDLGAPLGEERAWEKQFAHTGDTRIASMRFAETEGGVRVTGRFVFPKGRFALVNPVMESFDFRQSNPVPAYVADFWLKKGSMTLSQWKIQQKQKARLEAIRKNEEAQRQRAERRIASEKQLEEVEDTTRFCRQPLSEKNDIFLQFYPVHKKVRFRRWLPTTTPDEKLPYYLPKEKTKDAQYVRLALSLYRKGDFALVLKTIEFFKAEQPHSKYRLEMRFLRANAMIKLGLQRQADRILSRMRVEAGKSPFALHAAMYLAYRQIHKKQWLPATETFLWLVGQFPDYADAWVFHLGAAEALYAVGQVDRALKEYEWVIEKAPDSASKAEGAMRQADLFMQRFQYAQALAGYYQAIHYFPEQAKTFSSVHINRAESLYWLGQLDRAKKAYMDFLKNFPGNPEGWRAMYRLAEIDGRQPGMQAQIDSRKWYYDTINAFPFSPGAQLARLRLMPCGKHGGFDLNAAEHFFKTDLPQFHPDTEVDMVPFHALALLAHVRTLITFKKEQQAVDLATAELARPGNLELHAILSSTLGGIFRKSILDMLAQGTAAKKYEALTFYKQKAAFLPKAGENPEETDYLLKLSQAASDLGMGSLAKEIADAYAKANAPVKPSRSVAQAQSQDIETRLQSSEQHFTEAKALWVASGMNAEQAVRDQLAQVDDDSTYSYQRELIYGLMEQSAKKLPQALSHAIRAQMLAPASKTGSPSDDLRVTAWIANLQAQVGDGKVAYDMYQNLEKHIRLQTASKAKEHTDEVAASLGIPPMPSLQTVELEEGRLLEKQSRWSEAAETYARAVSEKIGGNEALYQYARSLQHTGILKNQSKARSVLQKLAENDGAKKDDFWKKLAREALADDNTRAPTP